MRWRLRAPGRPTVIIKGQFGSPEFAANYRAAIEGGAPVGVPTNPVGHQGTIAYFARSYLRSAVFVQLAPNTARMRRAMLDEFVSEFGKFPINKLEHRYVRKIIDRLGETPGKALAMLTAIRTLTALALGDGVIASDPCVGIKKPKLRGEGIHDWTEGEIATFESYYPIGTHARLIFALALYTGQRASDLIRMGLQHTRNGKIEVKQQKTKTPLLIPIDSNLQAILDATPSGHLTILVNEHGRPYQANSLSKRLTRYAEQAGIKDRSIHGLRKARCRRLAEAGCTAHEIMSISGHKSLKEVERYTKAASQEMMAERAIARTKSA